MKQQAAEVGDEAKLVIDVEQSRETCAGAAAAFVLRTLAARAGAYAPGINELWFHQLQSLPSGRSLDSVEQWFRLNGDGLHQIGFRVYARRIAFRTEGVMTWVGEGLGLRGAILATSAGLLHPEVLSPGDHAIGLVTDKERKNTLIYADPWDGTQAGEAPAELVNAHRHKNCAAVVLYWSGYS